MYLATCKGLSLSDARRLGREPLEEVGLGDAANRKLSTFFPRYEEERSLKRSR